MTVNCLLIVALLRLAIASDNPGSHTNNDVNVDNSKYHGDIDAVYNGHIVQNQKLQSTATSITGVSDKTRSMCPQKRKCLKQDGASCVQKGKCGGIISKGCSKKCDCCTPDQTTLAPTKRPPVVTYQTTAINSEDDAIAKLTKIMKNQDDKIDNLMKNQDYMISILNKIIEHQVSTTSTTTEVPTEASTAETPTAAPTEPHTTSTTTPAQGCPVEEGFILVPATQKCLKLFNDTRRDWTEAKSKCLSEGLVMAETEDPVPLRSYIVTAMGNNTVWTWIGGKGDGSNFRWQSDFTIIPGSNSNPNLWWYYSADSYRCLCFLTRTDRLSSTPNQPFYADRCAHAYWTLCELPNKTTTAEVPTDAPTTEVPIEATTTETHTAAPTKPPTSKTCPGGFFLAPGTQKCMKLFDDTGRLWPAANSKCKSEGLVMAETEDPVSLRSYLVTTMGVSTYIWLGGKGDGSKMRWQTDNTIIDINASYWYSYGVHSSFCLALKTDHPTNPFASRSCTWDRYLTLCELV